MLADVVITQAGTMDDARIWSPSPTGNFSISSNYHMLVGETDEGDTNGIVWKKIWRVEVSERVRTFLWLVALGRIATNNHLAKCRVRHDSNCEDCGVVMEDAIHVLRDCPRATAIWNAILPQDLRNDFFALNKSTWLNKHLQSPRQWRNNYKWSAVFGLTCWWIWKWRCNRAHGEETPPAHCCAEFISRKIAENDHAWKVYGRVQMVSCYQIREVSWAAPQGNQVS